MPIYDHRFPYPAHTLHKMLSEHPEFSPRIKLIQTGATLVLPPVNVNPYPFDGGIIVLDRAAGITVTLPPAVGSGVSLDFFVKTTVTSNNHIIKVANSSDTMVGVIYGVTTTIASAFTGINAEAAGGTDDTITMNGSTSGAVAGTRIKFTDIGVNVWHVEGMLVASGSQVTTLSATV